MRIILSGGGTGGHIFPNIAIVEEASKKGEDYQFLYIGEGGGLEEEIVKKRDIPFSPIYCGKLRRYFSFQNILDGLKVPIGFLQALKIIKKFQPDVIFSKGGYVSVPVVIAGWLLKKRIISHDSDAIPGLATRINARFSEVLCLNYKEAASFFMGKKIAITGIPTMEKNLNGDKEKALKITGFDRKDPILLVLGGSLGARVINEAIWSFLKSLLQEFQIIHLTGAGKEKSIFLPPELKRRYFQRPFSDSIGDLYAISDVALTRAGAGVIAELRSFGIPFVLVPLSLRASHGDQIKNAEIHLGAGHCLVLHEEDLEEKKLLSVLKKVYEEREIFKKNLKTDIHREAAKTILKLLDS